MTVFDTETMAELCFKQGQVDQAIGIFRRLAQQTSDPAERDRFEARISALGDSAPQPPSTTAPAPAPIPLELPGLRVTERSGTVEIEWHLPPDTRGPTLQILLLRRTPDGIQTDPRAVPLATAQGRIVVTASDLCGVRAAAGRLEGEAFVPLVRFPDRVT